MDVIKEFERSLGGRKASTIRLYVARAKRRYRPAVANASECRPHAELLALIRETQPEKRARIAPFLRFLAGGWGRDQRLRPCRGRTWDPILGDSNVGKAHPLPEKPLDFEQARHGADCLTLRRTQRNPRNCPRNCLKITGDEVILWDRKVEEPAFALALRYWHTWRGG